MTGCPAPWFISVEVPARVGVFPRAIGVRLPVRGNLCRMPAAPIRLKVYPCPIRTQRLIKIAYCADREAHRGRVDLNTWRCDLSARYLDVHTSRDTDLAQGRTGRCQRRHCRYDNCQSSFHIAFLSLFVGENQKRKALRHCRKALPTGFAKSLFALMKPRTTFVYHDKTNIVSPQTGRMVVMMPIQHGAGVNFY